MPHTLAELGPDHPNRRMDDGGPAFPSKTLGKMDDIPRSGMSLRDYLTGQALAGLAAWSVSAYNPRSEPFVVADRAGELAVILADATLKALKTPKKEE